jgi:hypothetical protein
MTVSRASLSLRLVLLLAAAIVGVGLGGLAGVIAAQDAEALVGGAMVAMSAMLGGALGLITGGIAGWTLDARKARIVGWLLGIPAAVLLGLGARGLWLMDRETRDPEQASRARNLESRWRRRKRRARR